MKAYKLFNLNKAGQLTPLFINKDQVLPIGVWMDAEDHPTKGFAHRPGWHCTFTPDAPHLKTALKNGKRRVWAEVEVTGTKTYKRPESQGGNWVLAERLKIVRVIGGGHQLPLF